MILVLGTLFAKADYLGSAGLARDVEPNHFYSGGGTRTVNHRPHSMNDQIALIDWNRKNLGLRAIEGPSGPFRPIVRTGWIVTHSGNRAHLFQKVRNVHLPFHPNSRMSAQQSDWCEHILTLAERRINRINVLPFGIGWIIARLEFARR